MQTNALIKNFILRNIKAIYKTSINLKLNVKRRKYYYFIKTLKKVYF